MSVSDEKNDWDDDFEWLNTNIENEVGELDNDEEFEKVFLGGNTNEANNKKDLFNFISSLQIMEYNFYGRLAKPCDFTSIKDIIDTNNETANLIAEYIGFDKSDLNDLYYFNILLRQVSYIESSAREGGASFNQLLKDTGNEVLRELASMSDNDSILLEDELSTNDISLQLKSAILPYALYYESFIKKATKQHKTDLQKFVLMIVSMARDVATKWNKQSSNVSNAVVFTVILPIIARFCMQRTEAYLDELIESNIKRHSFENKDIFASVSQMDGGYNDFPQEKKALFDKIDSHISATLDLKISLYWNHRKLFPKEMVKLIVSERLYERWLEFCEIEVKSFKNKSNDEKQRYLKDNNNLINTDLFFEMITKECEYVYDKYFIVDIDWKSLENNIRDNFSRYWGVSDAVFKKM
ncbi:hypothetical protein L1267_15795 [Pseudoalteromonas sp. OFAV1]|jgi:hypothetical protein|uniref:hypothetical protein n=1 Tax=Pseudoalteromonas sp. OFAV1 TaxID=2908892 RepID=UPI001F1AD492|nr:hypothetical protein [Pseudoalteromonas sp. OFAV1]MCF2901839.1 hypothetical protein [Pseudoalteromonas sp. OFAV1]